MVSSERLILLLGEGNFSLAAALALAYSTNSSLLGSDKSRVKIMATDFIFPRSPSEKLGHEYRNVEDFKNRNIQTIRELGFEVVLDVDATRLDHDPRVLATVDALSHIVFNFPHAQRKKMHLGKNRELLRSFFQSVENLLKHRSSTLEAYGSSYASDVEVHVSLLAGQSGIIEVEEKKRDYGNSWKLIEMAACGGLVLKRVERFTEFWKILSNGGSDLNQVYQSSGYRNCGKSFNWEGAKTFTFMKRLAPTPPILEQTNKVLSKRKFEEILDAPSLPTSEQVDDFDFDCSVEKYVDVWTNHLKDKLKTFPQTHPLMMLLKRINQVSEEFQVKIKFQTPGEDVMDLTPGLELCMCRLQQHQVELLTSPLNLKKKIAYDLLVGKSQSQYASINLTDLFKMMTDKDYRLLFSEYLAFKNVSPTLQDQNIFTSELTTGSFYPKEYSHDISFWINHCCVSKIVSSSSVHRVVQQCAIANYGLILKSLCLVEQPYNPVEAEDICQECREIRKRTSYCYRIKTQSLDKPLSHETCLDFHETFGIFLRIYLLAKLR